MSSIGLTKDFTNTNFKEESSSNNTVVNNSETINFGKNSIKNLNNDFFFRVNHIFKMSSRKQNFELDIESNTIDKIHYLINFSLVLFLGMLILGVIKYLIFQKEKRTGEDINKTFSFLVSFFDFCLKSLYFFFIYLCILTTSSLDNNCVLNHTYLSLLTVIYTIFSVVDAIETVIFLTLVVLSFPFFIRYLIENPKSFFNNFGVSKVRKFIILGNTKFIRIFLFN